MIVPVVLSGGAGTRLWPLSREAAPKPFMPLPDGETLLGKTAIARARGARLARRCSPSPIATTTSAPRTSTRGSPAREPVDAALPARAVRPQHGARRGGGGAARRGARTATTRSCWCCRRSPDPRRGGVRRRGRARGGAGARPARWSPSASRPTLPETGFGYIECGAARWRPSALPAFAARRFVEKPPLATAREYLAAGNYVWNSGMFCFTRAAILAAFARHAPGVLAAARRCWQPLSPHAARPMLEIDAARFAAAPDVSIDYAVMEKAAADGRGRGRARRLRLERRRLVAGGVRTVRPRTRDGNRGQGERVAIVTRGTYVHAEDRVVATIGVENLVIVDTPDAVLVAHRDHLQRVKDVVGELKARGHESYRCTGPSARPWGAYTVLQEGPGLQDQAHRGEARRRAVAAAASPAQRALGRRARRRRRDARRPESSTCRRTSRRSSRSRRSTGWSNRGTEPLVMIEVQCGDYVGEDDIVRFDDQYGRSPDDTTVASR